MGSTEEVSQAPAVELIQVAQQRGPETRLQRKPWPRVLFESDDQTSTFDQVFTAWTEAYAVKTNEPKTEPFPR